MHKTGLLLIIILTLASCTKSETLNNTDTAISSVKREEQDNRIIFGQKENERRPSYEIGGLVYRIKIPNMATVRRLPFNDSETTDTLPVNTVIDIAGADNGWLALTWGEESHGPQKYGWILSEEINIKDLFTTELFIINTDTDTHGNLTLNAQYILNDEVKEFIIIPNKQKDFNNYTFFWDYRNDNFHYSCKPGLYIWNDDNRELNHISYIISDGFLTWKHLITGDLKYLFMYSDWEGSSLNSVCIWNLENCEIIFTSRYYGKFNLNEETMETAKYYDSYFGGEWQNHEGEDNWTYGNYLTGEEKEFARNYIETNNIPEEFLREIELGYGAKFIMFIILIEHNIETNTDKISGGKYIVYSS